VNPIPRVLWPNKPEIGLDYARARGMDWTQADGAGGGVAATISTGMIGQGLANFGPIFGPPAAALLMALWVTLLTRQDLLSRSQPNRLLLYALGCVLTVNLGRDITLLVLYPFFFGLIFYHVWRRIRGKKGDKQEMPTRRQRPQRQAAQIRKAAIDMPAGMNFPGNARPPGAPPLHQGPDIP